MYTLCVRGLCPFLSIRLLLLFIKKIIMVEEQFTSEKIVECMNIHFFFWGDEMRVKVIFV
jgi:hypothetical protein